MLSTEEVLELSKKRNDLVKLLTYIANDPKTSELVRTRKRITKAIDVLMYSGCGDEIKTLKDRESKLYYEIEEAVIKNLITRLKGDIVHRLITGVE